MTLEKEEKELLERIKKLIDEHREDEVTEEDEQALDAIVEEIL